MFCTSNGSISFARDQEGQVRKAFPSYMVLREDLRGKRRTWEMAAVMATGKIQILLKHSSSYVFDEGTSVLHNTL